MWVCEPAMERGGGEKGKGKGGKSKQWDSH